MGRSTHLCEHALRRVLRAGIQRGARSSVADRFVASTRPGAIVGGSRAGLRRTGSCGAACFCIAATCTANGSRMVPTRNGLQKSFVAGINAFVDLTETQPELLPPEFGVLGYKPSHWSAADVVRIRSNGLWRNLTNEVERARILCSFPASVDALHKKLEPSWSRSGPSGSRPLQRTGERPRRLSAGESAGFVRESLQRARSGARYRTSAPASAATTGSSRRSAPIPADPSSRTIRTAATRFRPCAMPRSSSHRD